MKRVVAVALLIAAVAGGTASAGPARSAKESVPFAWFLDGQSRVPIERTRIRLARTAEQAKSWYDEVSSYYGYGGFGEFKGYAALGVFYAGDHPAVRITGLFRSGTQLLVSLAVAPAQSGSPSKGAYNVVAVAQKAVAGVRNVWVTAVDERPLDPVPYRREAITEPEINVREAATPHAGKVFRAVGARFVEPESWIVTHVGCRASLGGRLTQNGDSSVLHGARLLRPIVRRDYTANGFTSAVSCSWRLPKGSAGKQLTLGENNCFDECATGITVDYAYVGGDELRGGASVSQSGWRWTVAR
jgi:hypothetical protein